MEESLFELVLFCFQGRTKGNPILGMVPLFQPTHLQLAPRSCSWVKICQPLGTSHCISSCASFLYPVFVPVFCCWVTGSRSSMAKMVVFGCPNRRASPPPTLGPGKIWHAFGHAYGIGPFRCRAAGYGWFLTFAVSLFWKPRQKKGGQRHFSCWCDGECGMNPGFGPPKGNCQLDGF